MKAVCSDDTLNGADADGMTYLPEFLRDDLRRSLPVEEEVADNLTHNTIGATIIRFGAGLFALECGSSLGHEGLE